MKTVGLAKIEKDEPEKNLKFAYVISRWLGVFGYLAGVWIGAFSTIVIISTIVFKGEVDYNFILNGMVTLLTFGTSVVGLITILKGKLFLERVVIIPVIIGLATSTVFYAFVNVQDMLQGENVSPLAGINGAIMTGLIIYLIIRAFWIGHTLRLAKTNRKIVERLEALEA